MKNTPSSKKKRNKRVTISRSEAMKRLTTMIDLLHADMEIVLWAEATLEAGNDIIMSAKNIKQPGASAYKTITQSLALNLSISLARLFDPGSKRFRPNKRHVASIPLLIRLLKQKRCQRVLLANARDWTPSIPRLAEKNVKSCQEHIDEAIQCFSTHQNSGAGRAASSRLRNFRNTRLAHSLMVETVKNLPRYKDLFSLADVARIVVDNAKLAIDGHYLGLSEAETEYREEANCYWRYALRVRK